MSVKEKMIITIISIHKGIGNSARILLLQCLAIPLQSIKFEQYTRNRNMCRNVISNRKLLT